MAGGAAASARESAIGGDVVGENSKISWCHHTFSPWWGCTRVSPGCEHCYAEAFAKRVGHGKRLPQVWGARAERRFFGDEHWREPLKWDAKAAKLGERHRVFCASMADVFEVSRDSEVQRKLSSARTDLFLLIERTPNLDWLLLTKRPENVATLVPWGGGLGAWPRNVWIGTTVEDQRRAEERLPHLLALPSEVRFVSYEPALEGVDFSPWIRRERPFAGVCVDIDGCTWHREGESCSACGWGMPRGIDWIIVGGESGAGARAFDVAWARRVLDDAWMTPTRVFVKQLGARAFDSRVEVVLGTPAADGSRPVLRDNLVPLTDRAGAKWDEWPVDLRIRQFPEGSHA
jgi:protein gp37